jgi:transposase-like protein
LPAQDIFRRIAVITDISRCRSWPDDVKAAIVLETLKEAALVSEVARRHGVATGLLFRWRCAACPRHGGLCEDCFAQFPLAADDGRIEWTRMRSSAP